MWICVGQHCTKKSLVHNRQLLWENNLFNFVSTMHRNNIGQKQQQHRNNMEQHCIEILWSHCCSNTSEAELPKKITCAMLAYNSWTTLHRKIIYNVVLSYVSQHCQWTMLCNLNNVVSIKLEKHCIGILYTLCCPNMSEATLHKKITSAILALSTQTCFCKKITYTVLSWSTWFNIAENNNLPAQF